MSKGNQYAPKTIPYATAMRRLSISRSTLDRLVDRDVFTLVCPQGRGIGKRLFLRTDEIDLYDETRSEAAVRDLRVRTRRLKPA